MAAGITPIGLVEALLTETPSFCASDGEAGFLNSELTCIFDSPQYIKALIVGGRAGCVTPVMKTVTNGLFFITAVT
jgi:hypothetical protein